MGTHSIHSRSKYGSKLPLLSVSAEPWDFTGFRDSKNFLLKGLSVATKKVLRVQETRFYYDQKQQDGVLSLDGLAQFRTFFAGERPGGQKGGAARVMVPWYSGREPPFLPNPRYLLSTSTWQLACAATGPPTHFILCIFYKPDPGIGLTCGLSCNVMSCHDQLASVSVQDNLAGPQQEAEVEWYFQPLLFQGTIWVLKPGLARNAPLPAKITRTPIR